jgi:hypothetical protein
MSDVIFFVPVIKVDCNSQNVCITWITYSTNVIDSGFTNDPAFNYSDDTNKRHQLNVLYYNSPNSTPIKLQCTNSSGAWVDVVSSTGDSPMSVINSKDGAGNPLNLNYGALDYPAYQHNWPGRLLVNATNCQAIVKSLYAPITNDYTYTHTQKSFNLRMINPDGSVANIMPPSSDSCRVNDGAPNLWQRTLDCVGSNRPTSIQLAVDEQMTQQSNWRTVAFVFNTHLPGNYFQSQDLYKCNIYATVDGANINQNSNAVAQAADAGQRYYLKTLHVGPHQLSITMGTDQNGNYCFAYGDVYGNGTYTRCGPGTSCPSNTVYLVNPSGNYFPSNTFNVNITTNQAQPYGFTLQ